MGRLRPIELKFRLSPDEYDLLQHKLAEAGMNRNSYLVRLITGATIFPRDQLIQQIFSAGQIGVVVHLQYLFLVIRA